MPTNNENNKFIPKKGNRCTKCSKCKSLQNATKNIIFGSDQNIIGSFFSSLPKLWQIRHPGQGDVCWGSKRSASVVKEKCVYFLNYLGLFCCCWKQWFLNLGLAPMYWRNVKMVIATRIFLPYYLRIKCSLN